jgi:hypothetical protein
MKQVTNVVFLRSAFPPHSINAFLGGDVLIEAGTRTRARGILMAVNRNRPL